MQFSMPPRGVELLLLILVLAAAIYDVRYRRIPNWITAPAVLIGLALNAFLSRGEVGQEFGWSGLLFGLKGLGLAFGLYLFLYVMRAMGAGDVKLMAAVGACVGWQDWFGIFVMTAIVGGILALVVVVLRKRFKTTVFNMGYILTEMRSGRPAYLTKEELDVRNPKSLGLPHGAVIAVGTLFFLAIAGRYGG